MNISAAPFKNCFVNGEIIDSSLFPHPARDLCQLDKKDSQRSMSDRESESPHSLHCCCASEASSPSTPCHRALNHAGEDGRKSLVRRCETPPFQNTRRKLKPASFYTTRSGRVVKPTIKENNFLYWSGNPAFCTSTDFSRDWGTDDISRAIVCLFEGEIANKKGKTATKILAPTRTLHSAMYEPVVNHGEGNGSVSEAQNEFGKKMTAKRSKSEKSTKLMGDSEISSNTESRSSCTAEGYGLTLYRKEWVQIDQSEVSLLTLRKRSYKVVITPLECLDRSDSVKEGDACTEQEYVIPNMETQRASQKSVRKLATGKMEWSLREKRKLKKLVNDNLDWNEISLQLRFPADECEEVYTVMFKRKRRPQAKTKETGPSAITARLGTLKHRQQFRQHLEGMKIPRPELQDLFAGAETAMQANNMFSSDLFTPPRAHNFLPVTPNTRPPVGLDSTATTPSWYRTPSRRKNHISDERTLHTPSTVQDVLSPQMSVGDKEKKIRDADRVILQMRAKMMRGRLMECGNTVTAGTYKKRRKMNLIDLTLLKDNALKSRKIDEGESEADEYFDESDNG